MRGADWLGVADLDEALALRSAGIEVPILAWLHGAETDFARRGRSRGSTSASARSSSWNAPQHRAIAPSCSSSSTPDSAATGSLRRRRRPAFARAAELESEGRLRVRGIFSHLSNTSHADDDAQLAEFTGAARAAADAAGLDPELRHLAATEAAIARPELRFDLVRIGIGLYGLPAGDGVDAVGSGPATRDGARGIDRRGAPRARRAPASRYGFTHRTDAGDDPRPRAARLRGRRAARGVEPRRGRRSAGARYPVVGRIAMDQFLVDVGDDAVTVGDRVVLWGDPVDGRPRAPRTGRPGPTPSTTRSSRGSGRAFRGSSWDDRRARHPRRRRDGGSRRPPRAAAARRRPRRCSTASSAPARRRSPAASARRSGLASRSPARRSCSRGSIRPHPASPLVHVDAYRLATGTEVEDLDLDWDARSSSSSGVRASWMRWPSRSCGSRSRGRSGGDPARGRLPAARADHRGPATAGPASRAALAP